MAVRTRHNTPVEKLSVSPTVHLVLDVAAYAEAYGIEEAAVWNDATAHLAEIATAAVREAAEKLGYVTDVRLEGTRTSVESYRPAAV